MNQYCVTTVAGNGHPGNSDGPLHKATFNCPSGIVVDPWDGSIYVADQWNHTIRKIYNNQVTTVAGCGDRGFQDGPALNAKFSRPCSLALDSFRNLYIADLFNHRIRKLSSDGKIVSTVAGCGEKLKGGKTKGNPLDIPFTFPCSMVTDPAGDLIIMTHDNWFLRKLDVKNNQVIKLATSSVIDRSSPRTSTYPMMTIDSNGDLYMSDPMQLVIVCLPKVSNYKEMKIVAGSSDYGLLDGPALQARFASPCGVGFDKERNLYITDVRQHLIRKLSSDGKTVTTVSGDGSGCKDGAKAKFNFPRALAADKDGNLLIVDCDNHKIRKMIIGPSWEVRKVLWVGHLKNEPLECYLALLPIEIFVLVLKMIMLS